MLVSISFEFTSNIWAILGGLGWENIFWSVLNWASKSDDSSEADAGTSCQTIFSGLAPVPENVMKNRNNSRDGIFRKAVRTYVQMRGERENSQSHENSLKWNVNDDLIL